MFRTHTNRCTALAWALCLTTLFSTPVQASEFVTLAPPGELTVREDVNPSAGTMSGANRARIQANSLIASLFLSKRDSDTVIQPGQLKLTPIIVPKGADPKAHGLKLCANLTTINGHYKLIGFGPLADILDKVGASLANVSFATKHSDVLANRYSDQTFIGRSYVAPTCSASQTAYYVPVSFSDAPERLAATFEIAEGRINARLFPINDQNGMPTEPYEMVCKSTRRLTKGFDCDADLEDIKATLPDGFRYSGLLQLALHITNRGETSVFHTRLSVPLP